MAPGDHRGFRPAGWIEAGRERMDAMRPFAERNRLSMIQLACQWNLAHAPVACVAPTLIQEVGPASRSIEDKRSELATLPAQGVLLPGAALRKDGNQDVVFVLQDGRARRRAVQLGGGGGGGLRQVLTGVRPGEVVIIDAPADLADGAAVSESRS